MIEVFFPQGLDHSQVQLLVDDEMRQTARGENADPKLARIRLDHLFAAVKKRKMKRKTAANCRSVRERTDLQV